MKKIFALILSALMALTLTFGSLAETTLAGGWSVAEDHALTDEMKTMAEKALSDVAGMKYTPIAYIASQVVAGTNHCILCTAVSEDADDPASYALVTIYQGVDGNLDVIDISDCDAPSGMPDLLGGWKAAESPALTDAAKAALEKAVKDTDGTVIRPLLLLATQLVSGTNYSIFCEVTESGAESAYEILHVYESLDDQAEITDAYSFLPSNG